MSTGQIEVPEAPSPAPNWAAAGVSTPTLRRRNWIDLFARWVVSAGGIAIIASVLGILLFISYEVLPLLGGAVAGARPPIPITTSSQQTLEPPAKSLDGLMSTW